MENKTHSVIKVVDPEEAKKWLTENNFYLQRSIKGSNINSLVTAMKNDEFPRGTTLYFSKVQEKIELIDGQHRLKAQIAANMSIEYCVITLECATPDEAHILYTQMDIGVKRSMPDRMRALELEKHISLTPKQATLLSMGVPYIKYSFGKIKTLQMGQMTPVQRLELCKEYEKGAAQFFKHMDGAAIWVKKAFLKPHFVALGAYLFHHSPKHSEYLWTSIVDNECGKRKDPRNRMVELAQDANTSAIGLQRTVVILQAFIQGWNAMVKDIQLEKLKPASSPASYIRISGLDISTNEPLTRLSDLLRPHPAAEAMFNIKKLSSMFPMAGSQYSPLGPKKKTS